MASLQPPATIENLPTDVLSNIFIRLLAKQLAQMRCVSKPWNALLSQSSFVKSHLDHSIHNKDEILLLFYKVFSNGTYPFSVHRSRSPDLELTDFIKLPVNLRSDGARIAGSVNGLICLYYGSHNRFVVHIWNPSLSAVLTLPPYSKPSFVDDRIEILFRFGYDPKDDDYKVIKFASLQSTPGFMDPDFEVFYGVFGYMIKDLLQVEVYSMKKGSWRVVSQRLLSRITGITIEDEVCVDGHEGRIHCLGFTDKEWELQTILAFDLGDETFYEMPLPDSICNVSDRTNVLGVFGGKLCAMSRGRDDGECELWVMNEYGVAESWVKLHPFSQLSGENEIRPCGFTLHNDFFFKCYKIGGVGLYDPIAEKVKIFKITGKSVFVRQVVCYVDSLVWVAPSECDISISRLQI